MEKILSVIIPTYNMENLLARCLDSLLVKDESLLRLLDILVINDGSKDCSSKIAHGYEEKYPGIIKVFDKENGNYGSCINRGLKEAQGKYVRILDSDDAYNTENLEEFLRHLYTLDVDMVISDYSVYNQDNRHKYTVSYPFPTEQIFKYTGSVDDYAQLEMHAVTYKVENLRKINYYQTEGVSYTDQEWIFSPLSMVSDVFYFAGTIYKYYLGRDGQTVDPKVYHKRVADRILGARVMIKELEEIKTSCPTSTCMNYLRYILWYRVKNIYLSCLIVNRDDSVLIQFDQELKKSFEEFYLKLNDIYINRYLRTKYIKKWRNTQKLPNKYWSLLYILLTKLPR